MSDKRQDSSPKKNSGKLLSRRNLLKGAAVGGVLISSGALAKKIISASEAANAGVAYRNDVASGDNALKEQRYVAMNSKEKKELVELFEKTSTRK